VESTLQKYLPLLIHIFMQIMPLICHPTAVPAAVVPMTVVGPQWMQRQMELVLVILILFSLPYSTLDPQWDSASIQITIV